MPVLLHGMHASGRGAHPDVGIAELAERQHGRVARHQLVALGLGRGAIAHRLRVGRLHRVHPGVYAVGHPRATREGRWMAAVLACGPKALLSHRSAGALWGLATESAQVEVTTPRRAGRGPRNVVLHESSTLSVADVTVRDGIPVTSVHRTILDLADVVARWRLERAFEQAERMQMLDMDRMRRVIERNPGRRGQKHLLPMLDLHMSAPDTRSELERAFLDLCRACRLPEPSLNVVVEGLVVDALWLHTRLVVELDGFTWHRTRSAFEEDRRRDAALARAGYRVLRITWRRLVREPAAVAADLRALLATLPSEPARPHA